MRLRRFFIPAATLAIGFVLGVWTGPLRLFPSVSASKQVRTGEGTLTNPLLECEIAEGTIDAEKINFRPDLERFVATLENETPVSEIAVYFRDLNNGPAFGIHQQEPFVPASLLKVPVMMSYYRAADQDPGILSRMLRFENSKAPQAQQTILPAKKLEKGRAYSVGELIERMIVYSDNDALLLLFEELPVESQAHLYKLLGVDASVITNPAASLSVVQYASFFRILYNASFLSQTKSEQALSLLARIDFTGGLRKGVPEDVLIAHKFGERQINAGERHLHDCGIVYYPSHPYLLCVMTRGPETPVLERAITDISKFVYEKVDEQYKKD